VPFVFWAYHFRCGDGIANHFIVYCDLTLDVVGEIVAAIPMTTWIDVARSARAGAKRRPKR